MDARLESGLLIVLTVCAVLVTGVVVRRELVPSQVRGGPRAPVYEKDWREHLVGIQWLGTPDAVDTILVYSDFQCPFCRQFFDAVDELARMEGASLAILHRNFPISTIHPHARAAAIAGHCASLEGRWREFHTLVFDHQERIPELRWHDVGRQIRVPDSLRYRACLNEPETHRVLAADSVSAVSLGIPGTPLVFVNGWRTDGTPTLAQIRDLLGSDRQ